MDQAYLGARIGQVRLLHHLLDDAGVPVVRPPGGHSVVIDAGRFLPHLPRDRFAAESLAAALYLEGGVRTVGLGGLAFGERDAAGRLEPAPFEYLRLAVPRRVYTDNHLAYVAETVASVWERRDEVPGLRPIELPDDLPHFTARFERA
jgi:tryptophanase